MKKQKEKQISHVCSLDLFECVYVKILLSD